VHCVVIKAGSSVYIVNISAREEIIQKEKEKKEMKLTGYHAGYGGRRE
jgi:hypothetical protein